MNNIAMNGYISCQTGLISDSVIYVLDIATSFMLKIDIGDFSYTVVSYKNILKDSRWIQAKYIYFDENRIILLCQYSNSLIEYDIAQDKYTIYGGQVWNSSRILCGGGEMFDGYIILYPFYLNDPILKFNVKNKKCENEYKIPVITGVDSECYIAGAGKYKDRLLIAIYDSPYIAELDVHSGEWKIYETGKGNKIETFSVNNDNCFYYSRNDEYIYNWTPEDGINCKWEVQVDSEYKIRRFTEIKDLKNRIIAVPRENTGIIIIDKDSNNITKIFLAEGYCRTFNQNRSLFGKCYEDDNENIILLPHSINKFTRISSDNRLTLLDCKLEDKDIQIANIQKAFHQKIIYEKGERGFKDFIHGMILCN